MTKFKIKMLIFKPFDWSQLSDPFSAFRHRQTPSGACKEAAWRHARAAPAPPPSSTPRRDQKTGSDDDHVGIARVG